MGYRIGVDIGGTFTDLTLLDDFNGKVLSVTKTSTTPQDLSIGVLDCIRDVANQGFDLSDVNYFVHGSTVATNTLLQEKGARIALLTTQGFKDIYELDRQWRGSSVYDLAFTRPRMLVPRCRILEVPERVNYSGKILTDLNESALNDIARRLVAEKIEAVAVCYLHSFSNPMNEIRTREILTNVLPEVPISLSSEVNPEFREFERTVTTVIDAYLAPTIRKYLSNLESKLRAERIRGKLLIMQSSGGIVTFEAARRKPVNMISSGPAGGVMGAKFVSSIVGLKNIITMDMGGTSADMSVIADGEPMFSTSGTALESLRKPIGGRIVRVPMIDMNIIGSGGGSIAWVGPGGVLKVGPQSAGAFPGPACYGIGGTEPTVTDAFTLLGYLNPSYLLGGKLKIHPEESEKALKKIAAPLGFDSKGVAVGIIKILVASLSGAIKVITLERGYDPRDFKYMVWGGSGPVIASLVARELHIPQIIIPGNPGNFSAFGMLSTDIVHDFVKTKIMDSASLTATLARELYGDLEHEADETLSSEGVLKEKRYLMRMTDLRYGGQAYEVQVNFPSQEINQSSISKVVADFHEAHRRRYGFAAQGEPVEFVNFRVRGIGRISKPKVESSESFPGHSQEALKGSRKVLFLERQEYLDCPIYDRPKLRTGIKIQGPAIVEEMTSTIVINPRQSAEIDSYQQVIINSD